MNTKSLFNLLAISIPLVIPRFPLSCQYMYPKSTVLNSGGIEFGKILKGDPNEEEF